MPGNLVLGLAAGYHYGDVRPFLASLERSGYRGKCVLFVSKTTRDLDRIGEHAVTLVPFERTDDTTHIPYNGLRYFLYLEYLRTIGRTYDRILMTDVRDVVFQRDPFDFPWQNGLNGTLEDRSMTIGQCPHNSRWVGEHLGEKALATIAGCPISCSGTTVGDHEAIMDYLRKLTDELRSFTPGERMAGVDQGIHNHLLHTGRIHATLHDNSGPILTLGYTKGEPRADARGLILNESGTPAHILHQYDRKSELFKTIREQFN